MRKTLATTLAALALAVTTVPPAHAAAPPPCLPDHSNTPCVPSLEDQVAALTAGYDACMAREDVWRAEWDKLSARAERMDERIRHLRLKVLRKNHMLHRQERLIRRLRAELRREQ